MLLTIYKNKEFAGILQRTDKGCELQLASSFIENSNASLGHSLSGLYFSQCG